MSGRHDYPDVPAFARAAAIGLVAIVHGRRTAEQFREWFRLVTVAGEGLLPETRRIVEDMAVLTESIVRPKTETAASRGGAENAENGRKTEGGGLT